MPSNEDIEIDPALDPALATPVANKKTNNKKAVSDENTPVPKANKKTGATKDEETKESKPKQPKPPNWRPEEDRSLCISWLNTSKDAATGTNQTKATFWDRIYAMYLKIMAEETEKKKHTKGFKPFPKRLKKPLEDRWYHIQHQVSKYCGYYSQVERRLRSGSNKDDLIVEAKLLFKTDSGRNFNLDHCWGILHHSPKWIKHIDDANASGKTKVKDKKQIASTPASSAATDPPLSDIPCSASGETQDSDTEDSQRPEGSKAAKKRKNDEINLANLIKGQKELLQISRENQKAFESYTDDMNMARKLSDMDEETRAYFQIKRKKAIEQNKSSQ
ncbi:hypothetical protein PTTG_08163 [Puccinia triticina 1-1 BBBD Race 1]|uniref:NAM-associated domain-containing protein n=1 Tax=Puccinia triticina (isolate 1-1 / race 1 (BBBD)) TaxID=630390 RepID=A0A180H2R0_PUCT1|nr:hypothetical protein PTTG_08163 [Puccinia triticina 1-1 BBBD Race 1]